MKTWLIASIAALGLITGAVAQDPAGQGSETVAKPKKKADPNAGANSTTPAADSSDNLPKIPSKLGNKAKDEAASDVSFKADTSVVTVDVAVLDNKGNPIPKIPRGNFRILEDNVPQTVSQYATAQAPMTVALVIEFSARYQQYWSMGWRDTLNASYGFLQTLQKDDYLAVIAYDLRTDILCDFTNDRSKIQEALSRLRIPGFPKATCSTPSPRPPIACRRSRAAKPFC
jgi:Ca-activated chloride channel family protein